MFYSYINMTLLAIFSASLYFISSYKKYNNINKTILITGCDSGFGKLLVENATNNGFTVIAACYTYVGSQQFLNNDKVHIVIADLSLQDGIQKIVDFTKDTIKTDGLYAIVNNAGICLPGNIDWLSEQSYKLTMDINFHAPVSLIYNLLPHIKKTKGRIINVTSVDGFLAFPSNAAYCASKHALEAYSDSLRCEMKTWDVKVTVIQPSTMKTQIAMNYMDNWLKGFENSDKNTQLLYGIKWAKDIAIKGKTDIENFASDPIETVSTMMKVLQQNNPPSRVQTGKYGIFKLISMFPDEIRDNIMYKLGFSKHLSKYQMKPPTDVVSHLTIKVSNLEKSIEWYQKFGFKCVGETINQQQFLEGGKCSEWKPLILLSEDKNMTKRGESYDAGMTRLSLHTNSVYKDIEKLSKHNIHPISEPSGKAAVYKDPDGFIVYLISFEFPMNYILKMLRFMYRVTDPCIFSWTFNVTNLDEYIKLAKHIGFTKIGYQMGHEHKNKPDYSILESFNMSTTDTIIKDIKMISIPSDSTGITLIMMDWAVPRTERKGAEKLNRLSISVKDVYGEINRLKELGLITHDVKKEIIPIYNEILVGCVEIDGTILELCQF